MTVKGLQVWRVTAKGPRLALEAVTAALDAWDEPPALSSFEDGQSGAWRIDVYETREGRARRIGATFAAAEGVSAQVEMLADEDWVSKSQSGLPPVRAGRFVVYGAHDEGRIAPNLIGLKIEAGLAFGTGHHGTTYGCLKAYDDLLKERGAPERVLDIGCGTGVLALAAAKTGARRVIGSDIDEDSVFVAREVLRLNQARGMVDILLANGDQHPSIRAAAPFDLVFANILARPLMGLAHPIARLLAPGGRAILSGFTPNQVRGVFGWQRNAGLVKVRREDHDGWVTLVVERRR